MLKSNKLLLAMVAGSFIMNKSVMMSPQPPMSAILRGEYENRIRKYSPPQKIFDVFSTIKEGNIRKMTLKDLLNAICFYNYSNPDQSNIPQFIPHNIVTFLGKQNCFEIYDYYTLVRFLAFDRFKISSFFQSNKLQKINKISFQKCLQSQIFKDYDKFIKESVILQSRSFKPKKQQFQQTIKRQVKSMFKDREQMTCDQLIEFRKGVIREIFQFQFLMYPLKNSQIDGSDFGRSIMKYVDVWKRKNMMKNIKNSVNLSDIRVNKEQYIGFHTYLQTNLPQLKANLDKKGALQACQITRLFNSYVLPAYKVSQEQISVLMKILDTDESGFVEKKQLMGVLEKLQYYTTVKSGQTTFTEVLLSDIERIKQKFIKIKQIIDE